MRWNREFMHRRTLLQTLAAPWLAAAAREIKCDVAVIGGSFGGVAAALAALRSGCRVVLTEETAWVGGQVTSQAVPPDEHAWIEQFGATASYRAYRQAVREYYRQHYPLTAEARRRVALNPGDGSVSRLTHEPRVSLAVLEAMLAPYASSGQLTVLTRYRPTAADTQGDRVRAVTVTGLDSGRALTVEAPYFLDATEQGDLLPLAKVEYVTGFESRRETGEPHAPEQAQPANIQSFTVCFALDYEKGADHTLEQPAEWAFWRDYVPQLRPAWPGKLLSWEYSNPVTLKPRRLVFNPEVADPEPGVLNLWMYRRIANRANFTPGAYASDITLVNWPQNDYWLGNLHEVPAAEAERHLKRAQQLSLSLVYWMQTVCGWKGLRLRGDVTGTEHGLAMYPYIRESRRIRAETTIVEQHVSPEARGRKDESVGEVYPDSVGVGSYRIDLHPSSGGDNYIDVSSLPFHIPLGALLPRRVENLIPACKNIGTTHITNGCYRLHPVEWNIGESAGHLAAQALRVKEPPRQIRKDAKRLKDFQSQLQLAGIEVTWPQLSAR
jgi:hypothetical protein